MIKTVQECSLCGENVTNASPRERASHLRADCLKWTTGYDVSTPSGLKVTLTAVKLTALLAALTFGDHIHINTVQHSLAADYQSRCQG